MLIHMLSQRLPPESVTGAPLQALQLADALRRGGDAVRLYTTSSPRPKATEAPGSQDVLHLPYFNARGLRSISRCISTVAVSRAISRAELVHGHALSPMVLGYALARSRAAPPLLVKPSLGGVHSEGELEKFRRCMPEALLGKALNRISAFAVLDETIRLELLSLGVPESRIFDVDNGVDLSAYRSADPGEKARLRGAFGIDPRADVVLFAGQLAHRKGVRELLEAWTSLAHEYPSAVLLFAGGGPLQAEVSACARRTGSVSWLGELPSVSAALRCADSLILPSRAESFGNVIVEAMASSVPVASTRVGVAPRVIDPLKNGWFIEDVSVAGIRSSLQQIFQDRANWESYGAHGRAAVRRFGFERVAHRYRGIYASLLASGG